MAIYKRGVLNPRLDFVGVEILTTFCFLRHILDPDMLEANQGL